MEKTKLYSLVEGLLFIIGDDGISLEEIAMISETDTARIRNIIKQLQHEYQNEEKRGFLITNFSNKYKLSTKPHNYEYFIKLTNIKKAVRLSQASLETLAIIAYKGPITRGEIETLRGVNSDNVIAKLKARELIEEVGKSELPGKPFLYRVTEEFMKSFNLTSLNDLPKLEVDEENENSELFV